jgi:hypothetical protein
VAATKLTSPKAESQAIVNDAAQRLGVDPSKLTDALQQAQIAQIDAQVAAGKLTKAQGDALKQRITAGDAPLVGVPGLDRGGFRGHRDGGIGFGADSKAVTDYLGITAAQLRTQLEAGKTLAQVATANGKTAAGLKDAMSAAAKAKLDAAVKAGTITQAQADARLSELASHLDDVINGTFEKAGPRGGFDHGGPGARGGFDFGVVGAGLSTVTDYLGITAAQLRTQLEAGKSLAQIATANGKTAAGLKDALAAAAKTRLDAAVKAGKLTQAQADQLQSRLTANLDDLVNGTFDGHHGGFGGRGFGGPGAPSQTPSDPTASYATGPFA